jgi:hypothetical protein
MSDAYWNSYNNALGAADKVRQNALARQAGGMIASGDTMGARNALYRGGDLANGGVMDTRIANDRKTKAEAASKWAQGLSRMMDDPRFANDPNAAYEAALPYAQKLGLDPQEAEADRQLFVRDPKGYASMLLEKAGKELQFFQTDQGIYVGDKGTGEVSQAARLPGKPQMFGDFLYVPEGEADAPTPRVGTPGFNPNAPDPRRPSTGGFNSVIDPLLKREGGFVARDGRSGAPANFGINQKYNPDVDVRNLTPDKAKELYRSRYWNAIDGDNLPPEAQAAVFDAVVAAVRRRSGEVQPASPPALPFAPGLRAEWPKLGGARRRDEWPTAAPGWRGWRRPGRSAHHPRNARRGPCEGRRRQGSAIGLPLVGGW